MTSDFNNLTLNQRKWQVKDILTAFERVRLHSEFESHLDGIITEEQRQRPPSEWTIQGNLLGSLLVRGCHDRDGWNFLNSLYSSVDRARHFGQKLRRRFTAEYDMYDALRQQPMVEQYHPDAPDVRNSLDEIVDALKYLAETALDDFYYRSEGEEDTVVTLISALEEACERFTTFSTYQQEPINSLLIALETMRELTPTSFQSQEAHQKLERVAMQLISGGGLDELRQRIRGLSA